MMTIQPPTTIKGVDFFAGGGGASKGLHDAGIDMLAALNHSPVAILTHQVNFAKALHFCCDIRTQDEYELPMADVMWASPDCTHHSIAKGGQSRDAKERALAEELPRFALSLNANCVMIENVKEFLDWGPVMERNGKMVPNPKRKGEYYQQWVRTMKSMGFVNYEYRLLNSADFGVPQSRTRYFGIFTRAGIPISWPQPTHDKHGRAGLKKWAPVRDVLDLDDRGRSIFTAWGKPIADKTLRRILAGLKKHVIDGGAAQFMDKRTSNPPSGKPGTGASIAQPSPTVATCYLPDLVTPQFLMKAFGGNPKYQSLPLSGTTGAITCADHHQLGTVAFLTQYNGGSDNCRALSINGPANTVPTENRFAPVQVQFLCGQYGRPHNTASSQPCPPLLTAPKQNVVSALLQANGTRANDDAARLTMPLAGAAPTLNTNGGNLYLMSYYGNGDNTALCRPCPTLSTHDRFAVWGFVTSSGYNQRPYAFSRPATPLVASRRHQYLVLAAPGSPVAHSPGDSEAMRLLKAVCRKHGIADIYMRMLKVSELKAIMGFPADYYLGGSATKQKEMLGNAVVPQVAEAIGRAMLPALRAAHQRQMPALCQATVERWEQGVLFEKEAA